MKRFAVLLVLLACTAAAAVPKGGPRYETDAGTVSFLRRHLLAGGDVHYPLEAAQRKQEGSGFYLMKLRADGSVESLKVKHSTGYAILDESATQTLRAYRFRENTKAPLLWLVSFAHPATVIVKVWTVDEKNLRLPPL